ncbi:potassium channel family protein [Halomontanus rarus]|uniref:potassium channel family protein n=1 Tax=Halomontanus rarus TaxID=3034020 RepID=UPI0023E883BB|nr:NAD-binding protein [Halovivax sp. TS33]
MAPWNARRTGYYLVLVAVTTLVFTLTYNYGMTTLEDRPQPLYRSLEIVFQTYTTTGYGQDAPWQTLEMNLLMIGMQLAGIGLILTAADVFAVPWLRNALEPSPPTSARDLEDHVVICEYTPRGEAFIAELQSRGGEYVVVEPDLETATDLHGSGYRVIHGDPESIDVLERVGLEAATAIVADSTDDRNASIALSAREVNPTVRVVTLVEDRTLEEYHWIAGADEVLSPRQLLGESLARQVPTAVTTVVDDRVEIGEDLELVELVVEEGSDLCRRTVADVGFRAAFGVDVVGVWFDGTFESPIDPTAELAAGTRLLVAGEPNRVARLQEEVTSSVTQFSPQRVVIAGRGEAGSVAAATFADTSSSVTVLDLEDRPDVDVVGDARRPAVLSEAGIEDASAVIVTVGDDTSAVFTTLVARDLNPEATILVRANDAENEGKLYRAGADYVQSLATVSGRMLASTIFEDEEVLAFDTQIDVVRAPAGRLAGRTLAESAVRSETGCTVLAVVKGGRGDDEHETITDFDPHSFRLEADDDVILAGTDESVRAFEERYLGLE